MDRMDFRPEKSDNTNIPRDRMPVRTGWSITDREQREAGELIRFDSRFDQDRAEARHPQVGRLWLLHRLHQCSKDGEELQALRTGMRVHIANNPSGIGASQTGRSLAPARTGT